MQVFEPSETPPTDLQAHICRMLDAADPAQVQRLLKHLRRLEPAARLALEQSQGRTLEDFDPTLRELQRPA